MASWLAVTFAIHLKKNLEALEYLELRTLEFIIWNLEFGMNFTNEMWFVVRMVSCVFWCVIPGRQVDAAAVAHHQVRFSGFDSGYWVELKLIN